MEPMGSPSQISQNMPNASLMNTMFTSVFGNIGFQLAPSQTGEVNFGFGTLPYLSLESVIYLQQINAQIDPTSIAPGQHNGQQNISGQYTVTGAAGNVQVAIGNASTTTGNF